jgi:hypothetical protein
VYTRNIISEFRGGHKYCLIKSVYMPILVYTPNPVNVYTYRNTVYTCNTTTCINHPEGCILYTKMVYTRTFNQHRQCIPDPIQRIHVHDIQYTRYFGCICLMLTPIISVYTHHEHVDTKTDKAYTMRDHASTTPTGRIHTIVPRIHQIINGNT